MLTSATTIRNVLLIDDDFEDYLIFEEAIHTVDPEVQVTFISSCDQLPRDVANTVPDLLFLDINMPDHDGFEWLKGIRDRGFRFPVIMYSTASNHDYVQKAYLSGANMYFPKPDSYHRLKESLQRILRFNWDDPGQVTANFYRNGHYTTFHL